MRPPSSSLSLVAFATLAACTSPPAGPARVFDPCVPNGVAAPSATAEQQTSIERALALWNDVGVDGLVSGGDPAITVEFREAAASIYGFYDDQDAVVYVNTELADPEQRAITIAHELGHALGLPHVERSARASVMNPGNLTVTPSAEDVAALTALWGACAE